MKKLSLTLLVLTILSGCAFTEAPFQPAPGFFYTNYRAPLTTEFKNVDMNKTLGEGHDTYVGYSIISFGFGDAGLKKAMEDASLKKVAYADYEFTQVLGVFSKTTVRAFGSKTN